MMAIMVMMVTAAVLPLAAQMAELASRKAFEEQQDHQKGYLKQAVEAVAEPGTVAASIVDLQIGRSQRELVLFHCPMRLRVVG